MAKTQLIQCHTCGTPLANLNTETGDIRLISVKKTEEGNIESVQKEATHNITNSKVVVCTCGITNGLY